MNKVSYKVRDLVDIRKQAMDLREIGRALLPVDTGNLAFNATRIETYGDKIRFIILADVAYYFEFLERGTIYNQRYVGLLENYIFDKFVQYLQYSGTNPDYYSQMVEDARSVNEFRDFESSLDAREQKRLDSKNWELVNMPFSGYETYVRKSALPSTDWRD